MSSREPEQTNNNIRYLIFAVNLCWVLTTAPPLQSARMALFALVAFGLMVEKSLCDDGSPEGLARVRGALLFVRPTDTALLMVIATCKCTVIKCICSSLLSVGLARLPRYYSTAVKKVEPASVEYI